MPRRGRAKPAYFARRRRHRIERIGFSPINGELSWERDRLA
jgi:hypothetical protein